MTIDLAGMRAAAEKATQGEWVTHPYFRDHVVPVASASLAMGGHVDDAIDRERFAQQIVRVTADRHGRNNPCNDAAFIATTNPAAVLALLDYVERLKEGLKPFAEVLADVGQDEDDADLYRAMSPEHRRVPAITVGDLRQARSLIQETTND